MFDYRKLLSIVSEHQKKNKCLVALVGAGGKTTTMYVLGRYFAQKGYKTLVTTTTKVMLPRHQEVDDIRMGSLQPLKSIEKGVLVFAGDSVDEAGKVTGFDPDELDKLDSEMYDVLIYEADGAKRRAIKAPREDEPRISKKTTCVIGLVGLDVLMKPATSDRVHRLEAFERVTGCVMGELISEDHVRRLTLGAEGLFKNAPQGSLKILLLTKMDDSARKEYAQNIQALLKDWEGIVIAI